MWISWCVHCMNTSQPHQLPWWLSDQGFTLGAGDPGIAQRWSHTSDSVLGSLAAALPDAWHDCVRVVAHATVEADRSPRHTLHYARFPSNQENISDLPIPNSLIAGHRPALSNCLSCSRTDWQWAGWTQRPHRASRSPRWHAMTVACWISPSPWMSRAAWRPTSIPPGTTSGELWR